MSQEEETTDKGKKFQERENKLEENINLCFLPLAKLLNWLNDNELWAEIASENNLLFKEKWEKELNSNLPSFFTDSELLLLKNEIILLQLANKNQVEFLGKTYQVKEQQICQKLFQENKNIILLTEKQWKKLVKTKDKAEKILEEENCFILFKDEENSKNSLTRWLESLWKKNID